MKASLLALSLAALAACDTPLISHDNIYSRGADHLVLCAQNIDDTNYISVAEIAEALDRAKTDGTTLHLYTHTPGVTVSTSTIEGALAAVTERGMHFATYEELSAGEVPGS